MAYAIHSKSSRRFVTAFAAFVAIAASLGIAATGTAQPPAPAAAGVAPAAGAASVPIAPDASGAVPGPVVEALAPPTTLRDLDLWLDYQSRARIGALPEEARVFYRQGRLAWDSGRDAEAVRLVRGAATLDPTFATPHWALANWYLTREPAQALHSAAALVGLVRRDFRLQLDLAGNAVFYGLQILFLAMLAVALLLIAARQHELRHLWMEHLRFVLLPVTARVWAWVFLILPFVVGFGVALPAIALLGMCWPMLRVRERFVFAALTLMVAAVPLVAAVMERLSQPLHDGQAPYYGVTALEHQPWTAERQAGLDRLAAAHPGNGFLQFGLAWTAQRGGDLATAEAAYRRTLDRRPSDDRALNNLGNLLAVQGRFDDALALYTRASTLAPGSAAPYFNASQVHTRRFDYHAASEAVARASALDFDLVKAYQGMTVRDGTLSLIDQWIAPRTFWEPLLAGGRPSFATGALPPAWRQAIEARGWPVSALAIALAVAAALLGSHWHRRLPLRPCSNCGRTVCRRCAERRREIALCGSCAAAASRSESPEFERVLLGQVRRRLERQGRLLSMSLALLIPCFGLVSRRRVFGPLALAILGAALVAYATQVAAPFAVQPRLGPATTPGAVLVFGCGIAIWVFSILGYLSRAPRPEPVAVTGPPAARPRIPSVSDASEAA